MALTQADTRATVQSVVEENARLAGRVRELEHLLERSRNNGLEHGLSLLSRRVMALRKGSELRSPGENRNRVGRR
jgi:hypothetical protein